MSIDPTDARIGQYAFFLKKGFASRTGSPVPRRDDEEWEVIAVNVLEMEVDIERFLDAVFAEAEGGPSDRRKRHGTAPWKNQMRNLAWCQRAYFAYMRSVQNSDCPEGTPPGAAEWALVKRMGAEDLMRFAGSLNPANHKVLERLRDEFSMLPPYFRYALAGGDPEVSLRYKKDAEDYLRRRSDLAAAIRADGFLTP